MAFNFSALVTSFFHAFIIPRIIPYVNFESFTQLPLPEELLGPISIPFDSNGDGPYTGVSDGRIFKYNGSSFIEFAAGNSNRSRKDCDFVLPLTLLPSTCGRPLGLSFNNNTGKLNYADAYYGLDVVNGSGGVAEQLTTGANGRPFFSLVDVATEISTGDVYATDYSAIYNVQNISKSIGSNDTTGRLVKYNSNTKQAIELIGSLSGAVGVAISNDGSFVLVSELIGRRIIRYWLKGPKANTSHIFRTLEGNPAEIRATKDGNFWVPVNIINQNITSIKPVAVKLDGLGNLVQTVDLSNEFSGTVVTVVEENLGKLYVGSFATAYIGVYTL